jgi:tetratricopeptide (TPR) repeat protein
MIIEPLLAATTVLTAIAIVYASVFVHELGHVLMGLVCGFEVTSFGSGFGPPLIVGKIGQVRVYLGWKNPCQGVTWIEYAQIFPSRWAVVGMLAGGVVANLLIAMSAWLLQWKLPWCPAGWIIVLVVNLFFAVGSLVPMAGRLGKVTFCTDGLQILQTMRNGQPDSSTATVIQTLHSLAGFFRALGDIRLQHRYLLGAASSWLRLGDVDHAASLCRQAESLPLDNWPFSRAFGACIRGFVECGANHFEASSHAFSEAEKLFKKLQHDAGLCLVALGRASWALKKGDSNGALAILDVLQSHPLAANRRVLQMAVLEMLVSVQAAGSGKDEVERLRAQYEAMRRRNPSIEGDRLIYQELATFYERHGDLQRAEVAYRLAIGAARILLEQFIGTADEARFRRCQEPLLAQFGRCLTQLGKVEEALRLGDMLPAAEKIAEERLAAENRRSRYYQRAGIALIVVNFLSGLAMVGIGASLARATPGKAADMPILLACAGIVFTGCALAGAGYAVLIWWLRFWMTRVQTTMSFLLLLGLSPWVVMTAALAFAVVIGRFG